MYSIKPQIIEKPQKSNKKTKKPLCFCRALKPGLTICRLFGLFPLTSDHKNGHCNFKKSNLWLGISIIRIIQLTVQLLLITDIYDIFSIGKGKSLHALLNSINDIVYGLYVTLLSILNVLRYPRFVRALNHLTPIIQEGLLCQNALHNIRRVQWGIIGLIIGIFTVQWISLAWLHFSENYVSDFDAVVFINRFTQNIPFLFYVLFSTTCNAFIAFLGCFENLVTTSLRYVPVHPMKGFDENNARKSFLGLIKYKPCEEGHFLKSKSTPHSSTELVEYLRSLHEEMSLVMYEINNCLNPQLLCHTVIELAVLIVNWYAVIIYIAYEFASPVANTIHFLNCFFVVFHTLGLFVFLKNAQQLHNMVHGLTNFLLEYSTRISLPEEHQQIRLFIEKLKLHRPITANGIFTIDLAIAGPICANILTYVLVALQFDVPKT